MNGYDPYEYDYDSELADALAMAESEGDRADEAERLLSEMAHAFRDAAPDAFAAFRAKEPGVEGAI